MKSVYFALILLIAVMISHHRVDSKIWKRRHHHEFRSLGNNGVHSNTNEERGERKVNTLPMNSGVLHRKFSDTPGGERRISMFSQASAEPCKEGYRRDGAGVCRAVWNK